MTAVICPRERQGGQYLLLDGDLQRLSCRNAPTIQCHRPSQHLPVLLECENCYILSEEMNGRSETIVLTVDNACMLPQDSWHSYRSQDRPDG